MEHLHYYQAGYAGQPLISGSSDERRCHNLGTFHRLRGIVPLMTQEAVTSRIRFFERGELTKEKGVEMTKDELIAALQANSLPGDAPVRFSCDAMVDDDIDELRGHVTGIFSDGGQLIIEGDGVPEDERRAYDKKWGHE